MTHVALTNTIGEGPDQEVRKIHENAWTRLLQVTLRNGKTLAEHVAKEPITVQCVAGQGTFVAAGERTPLVPGTIVLLEPEVPHAVESNPAVSILVTRFLPPRP